MNPVLFDTLAHVILGHLHREFPHRTGFTWADDDEVRPSRATSPAFFGSYDWHSSVHSHWALARLLRHDDSRPWSGDARAALDRTLTSENIARECTAIDRPHRLGYEMPYGVAWLLALDAELECDVVAPLSALCRDRFARWLDRLPGPVRHGVHTNTAFALALVHDSVPTLRSLVEARSIAFFGKDVGAPVAYEPSAHDFLSPTLAEAVLMKRALGQRDFDAWLGDFLPEFAFEPVTVRDRTDYQLSHRDGLNLSRAWMLRELGDIDRSDAHLRAGLAGIEDWTYAGAHWLPTFAVRAIFTPPAAENSGSP